MDRDEFLESFKSIFLDLFFSDYLLAEFPEVFNLARLLGVIDVSSESGSDTRSPFRKVKLNLDRIPAIIDDPLKLPLFIYGWNTSNFRFDLLIQHLDELFSTLGVTTYIELDDGRALQSLVPGLDYYSPYKLVFPLNLGYVDNQPIEFLFELIKWPPQNGNPAGVALVLTLPLDLAKAYQFTDDLGLALISDSATSLSVGFVLEADFSLDVLTPFAASPLPFTDKLGISFEYKPTESLPLLGSIEGSRLDLKGGTLAFDILPTTETIELRLRLVLTELSWRLKVEEGDSFIGTITNGNPIEGSVSLDLQWSSLHGINFAVAGLLEWIVPTHIDLGFVMLESFNLRVKPAGNKVPVTVQTSLTTALGPLDIVVRNIGLEAVFTFPPDYSGNLGPVDLDIGFKPPSGAGISVDGGGFKGGGFLDFDPEAAFYFGMLELEFQDRFTLKAFGLLNTRLPNGQSGFSLLIVISSEFTPIQLGLGFKLNGVGGLLGLNRTINIEPLRAGLRANTLSSILFPTDVVAKADRIISDLKQVFPPQEGRFIFGPMAKIGWGTPTLVTIDLGLVIEIPDPVRLFILGVLRAVLPDEKAVILQVQVNFLGEINFERRQLKFDASLFDSKLLGFNLSGDMAIRLDWGADANFLLTVGGFHPAYEPPPMDLPAIRRLTLSLLSGDNPRLRLEMYFAVTSNTAQFGAKLELLASASKFNVYGFLSFDVLFQFNPFYFIAEITAMLALRVGSSSIASIKLTLTLEGPTPWKAQGTASFKICWFFTLKVRFNKTFGEMRNTMLPDLAVLPLLAEALRADDNWEGELPPQRHRLESIREAPELTGELLLHPVGTLKISQKVVPLNVRIDRIGNQRPSDGREFQIVNPQPEMTTNKPREAFAPAQFFDLTDEQKLTSASFKDLDSGVRVGDAVKLHTGYAAAREVQYEVKYIDSQRDQRLGPGRGTNVFDVDPGAFNTWTLQGAIAQSELSFARKRKSSLAPEAVAVSQEPFAIVNSSDLQLFDELSLLGSEHAAVARLNELVQTNPGLRGTLQVVPAFEMAA
ncbi:DUF6603 domain-containing protein [Nitrosospira multiformis]|uniref:DUF6603 domain-containing protein n=1 Tax=Nitrosospira multiformis TaxID=1231 RepID=UPI0011602F9D|nr:DUF6603 domain-containing protein [Nitrosospira multiformis]